MSDSEEDESLKLSLSPPGKRSQSREQSSQASSEEPERRYRRSRQSSADRATPSRPKEESINPPYPWSTDRRAVVHSLEWLTSYGITSVHGEVICKRCDGSQMAQIDLQSSFLQVNSYFLANRDVLHDRAPKCWTSPRLLDCTMCQQSDCVKPAIHAKKRNINWLFLLLTQTLGLCTLDQLKYFCKHTRRHRTGAKDRVLYLTYVGLLKQLNPAGPYE
ncbi:hypothetical protein O6H91_04G131400 [Diphasiastrum complanatum]|uniref:Uncharacterized protein n=3 Tax=Diphasiastrum complanatum TaxID=34168 RepID=A0ACC2E2H9_DIPCM|nr:hypothetical protein O6H91_04G131400 [Diphasiastrum complanatum]KAJ7560476.1 hypothetical protein O6H91_04G131400 [Diphasiastrum complanatum]KAJ7560477.1 hypothetical protein O6H91_04G131400 [Diphasiastrum complanatum]